MKLFYYSYIRQFYSPSFLLSLILLFSFLVRIYGLNNPPEYYFDEVYHAPTAKAYAVNNPAGYEWWHDAPEPNTAYEWLHPPIGKLFMAAGIKLFGVHPIAWRIPGAIFGVLVIWMTYLLGLLIFKNVWVAIVASLVASLDGLLLTMSRIGMNDIYVTFFFLTTLYSYLKSKQSSFSFANRWLWLTGVNVGLAISTKWSGVFTLGIIGTIELFSQIKTPLQLINKIPYYIIIYLFLPVLIYLLSYGQFWLQGHTWSQFGELHNQIWYYQTHLDATHPYQSQAWEWPIMLRPVWMWVKYFDNGQISNIYNLGNPIVFWFGLASIASILLTTGFGLHKVSGILLISYLWTWAPWLLSPRIMFFYHYTPAVPFLCLASAGTIGNFKQEKTGRFFSYLILSMMAICFIWFLPIWIGIPIDKKYLDFIFWLPTWR